MPYTRGQIPEAKGNIQIAVSIEQGKRQETRISNIGKVKIVYSGRNLESNGVSNSD